MSKRAFDKIKEGLEEAIASPAARPSPRAFMLPRKLTFA